MLPAPSESGFCPLCHAELPPELIRRLRFDCPQCGKTLQGVRSTAYKLVRGLFIVAFGIVGAMKAGFEGSFLVFVVAFYALPGIFLWESVAQWLFPAKTFEPVKGPFQTLGLPK